MQNIINGTPLTALQISENIAQAVTTMAQLKQFGLLRPTLIDKRPKKDASEDELRAHEIHDQTQRNFDKARKDRAMDYAGYIKGVEVNGEKGGTPPITLYFPSQLEEENDMSLIIPFGADLTAIDGETQTEARYLLAETHPETMNTPIGVLIYHGIELDHAKQILHDVNHYVTPVSEMKTSTFNTNGSISKAASLAIISSGLSYPNINMNGLAATKSTIFAHYQLMTFIAGCQLGSEFLSKTVTANVMSKLNSPIGSDVDQGCIDNAANIIKMAIEEPVIGSANKALWQVAGVLCSQGRSAATLNWAAGVVVYNQMKDKGRGGKRMSTAEKLKAIALAL